MAVITLLLSMGPGCGGMLTIVHIQIIKRMTCDISNLYPLCVFVCRFEHLSSRCSITNTDVQYDHVATDDEVLSEKSVIEAECPIPIVHLKPDILESDTSSLLTERAFVDSLLTALPVRFP